MQGTSVHRARVRWEPEREDLRAHTVELAGQTLATSSAAVLGGDPEKADPEEMFVASLSSCHMLWFPGLARAERLRVASLHHRAHERCFIANSVRCLVDVEPRDHPVVDS